MSNLISTCHFLRAKNHTTIMFSLIILFFSVPNLASDEEVSKPQCAQYSVDILCKLLGVPIDMPKIMELIPPKKEGESMLEIMRVLEYIGFNVEGKQITFADLMEIPLPVIVHMKSHFGVVEVVNKMFVTVSDNEGRRKVIPKNDFIKSWDGRILFAHVPSDKVMPAYLPPISKREPCIKFEKLLYDIGDILQNQETIDFEFTFENIGKGPLVIEKIKAGCKCTIPYKPEEPIQSGGKDKILIRYKKGKRVGPFAYSVYVRSNDQRFPIIKLIFAGNVVKKIFVNPYKLDFGEIIMGDSKEKHCFIWYTGDRLLELLSYTTNVHGLTVYHHKMTQELAQYLLNGKGKLYELNNYDNRYLIDVTFNSQNISLGEHSGYVNFRTNLKDVPELSIPVKILVVPTVETRPRILFLGEIMEGEHINKEIILLSRNSDEFKINSVNMKGVNLNCQFDRAITRNAKINFKGQVHNIDQLLDNMININGIIPASGETFNIEIPIYVYNKNGFKSK